MPSAAIWMDRETIILSEVSQPEKKINDIAYMWNIKQKKNERTYLQNRNRSTDLENKLMVNKGEREGNKLGIWN